MSFIYPAGLLALLALAVPLALSLMRRRSETTRVSSVYLWQLSDQHRKKKRTLSTIKRALFLVMQCAAIVISALLVAQPVMTMPGSGVNVAVILDGSASMRMADAQGKTRFEHAVASAERDMGRLPWGASVTVIVAGDEASVAADHVSAGNELHEALAGAQCGWGAGDVEGAIALCEEMMAWGAISQVRLYSDKEYAAEKGLETVLVRGENEWNVRVGALSAKGSIYGTAFETTVLSSGRSADVTFELIVDGKAQDAEEIDLRVDGQTQTAAYCPEGEEVAVSLLLRQVYAYQDVRLRVVAQDGLREDNETRLIAAKEKTARALLVGENVYFWEKALDALSQVELTTETDVRKAAQEGYDIYAFVGCLPEKLPADGAVWLLNPPRSPREAGVVFGEKLMGTYVTKDHADGELASQLSQNLLLRDAAVARFTEMTAQGALQNVLLCGEMPVMAAGRNKNGCAVIVAPFDIEESNLPLLADFVVLVHNMTEASAPALLNTQSVLCGETVYPQMHPLSEKLFVQTPDMRLETLTREQAQEGVHIAVPGGYTLMQEVRGEQQMLSFCAQIPEEEGTASLITEEKPLELTAPQGAQSKPEKRVFYPSRIMAALLAVLLLAEWGMYHRERY